MKPEDPHIFVVDWFGLAVVTAIVGLCVELVAVADGVMVVTCGVAVVGVFVGALVGLAVVGDAVGK